MEAKGSLRRNILNSLRAYRVVAPGELYGYCLGALGQVSAILLQIWFGGRVINDLVRIVSQHQSSTKHLVLDAGVLVAATIVEQACWALLMFWERQAYLKWSRYNYMVFLSKTSQLSLGQFEDKETKQKMNMLWQEGYAWKPINFAQELLYTFHGSLRMLATFVVLVSLLPWLVPILLLASVPTLLVEKRAAGIKWGIWNAHGDDSQTFWAISLLLYSRDSVLEIKPQGSREFLLKRADDTIGAFFRAQVKVLRSFVGLVLTTRLFEGLVVGGINIWLLLRVVWTHGRFTIGQYSIYVGMVQQFQSSTGTVYKNLASLFDYNNFMTIYNDFLNLSPMLEEPKKPVKLAKDEPITIEFKNVRFGYPQSKEPIFDDLNLTIEPGDHIAIVGENGAGKSTLIKLLLRFYDVNEGQILINGTDLRQLDIGSWYYHVGALFQTFNHYPLTLFENVSIGRAKQAPQAKAVQRALQMAGINKLTSSLEYKEDTILDASFQKGTELSGGQWQKVALARAFYRDAPILILDEPTSAVDAKAEYAIFEQIRKTQADKTTLIVSHRFSTVRQADRILVIEKGKIIEDGSHDQLVKKAGLYKEMFEKQAAGYR